MKIINQSHEILFITPNLLQFIEHSARTCYKSEDKITTNSAEKFVEKLISNKHDAMLEFGQITVKFITNRGVTHELVRHRLCSFAQESTRYVKYNNDIEFIKPAWLYLSDNNKAKDIWVQSCFESEKNYNKLLDEGWLPQHAREVLPNSLKTEIIVQANPREWRHILKLRTSSKAHPQIRTLMIKLCVDLKNIIPVLFKDIIVNKKIQIIH